MCAFERFEFAQQRVVFGIGDRRLVKHVIAMAGLVKLRAQGGGALGGFFGNGCGHTPSLACPFVLRYRGTNGQNDNERSPPSIPQDVLRYLRANGHSGCNHPPA